MPKTPKTKSAAAETQPLQTATQAEQQPVVDVVAKIEQAPIDQALIETAKKADDAISAALAVPQQSDAHFETKEYADGTQATGVAPLPDESPAGAPAVVIDGSSVHAAVAAAALVGAGVTVIDAGEYIKSDNHYPETAGWKIDHNGLDANNIVGLGYVLNLADVEAVARLAWVAVMHHHDDVVGQDTNWADLADEDRQAFINKVEDVVDGKATADEPFTQFAVLAADAIKSACDTLLHDYLRQDISPATGPMPDGVRSVDEARALRIVEPTEIAYVYEAPAPGHVEAFRDNEGTTRRVVVMPDGTLAAA